MPYVRALATTPVEVTACHMLVLVQDSGRCQVEEFLRALALEAPVEFRQLAAVLSRALFAGPRSLHNKKLSKHVGGAGSGLFEFRARSGLARVLWFYAAAVHRREVETIVLVSGFREKQVQQTAIEAAAKIRRAYLSAPFELRDR